MKILEFRLDDLFSSNFDLVVHESVGFAKIFLAKLEVIPRPPQASRAVA
tara:strand:+ start:1641 stop:1787 length:147 start_codon:yes stop_codon:yes gene_type:complete